MTSRTSKRADLAPMPPARIVESCCAANRASSGIGSMPLPSNQPMFSRLALWLSRGDNAFHAMLFIIAPPLGAIIAIGML